jgi:hypothetical protein
VVPSAADRHDIATFQLTNDSFSSPEVRRLALGGAAPELPWGHTATEIRGRRFFEDVPPNPADGFKPGLCAHCHSGPMLDRTNLFAAAFIGLPTPAGQRFISVGLSEFNDVQNPPRKFIFDQGTPDEFTSSARTQGARSSPASATACSTPRSATSMPSRSRPSVAFATPPRISTTLVEHAREHGGVLRQVLRGGERRRDHPDIAGPAGHRGLHEAAAVIRGSGVMAYRPSSACRSNPSQWAWHAPRSRPAVPEAGTCHRR